MARRVAVTLLAALTSTSYAAEIQVAENPIRKVVTMLQRMEAKVKAEGEKEEALYKKFMCYCKSNGAGLDTSISNSQAEVTELASEIQAAQDKAAGLKTEIADDQASRQAAKDAIAKATALREREAAEFAKVKSDGDGNTDALVRAIAAIEKGMAGFLQTGGAQVLRQLAALQQVGEDDKQQILAFAQGTRYAPASGEVVGILKQILETMSKGLLEAMDAEAAAKKAYAELVAAKQKEIAALSAGIERKTRRLGEAMVEAERKTGEQEATQASLDADQAFLRTLQEGCATKAAEWEERSKTRQQELLALAETIKVLNDDDALDVFKKTLPSSASLVQLEVTGRAARAQALQALSGSAESPQMDLILLALRGKKMGFEKVISMIDELVANLAKEQQDDADKKAYCLAEFDTADDRKKGLERNIAAGNAAISDLQDAIAKAAGDIAALQAKVKTLDQEVAEATAQRKAEHEDFVELMANDSAAKQLLDFAKNRLNKFYNEGLHTTTPKPKLSREDQLNVAFGGEAPTTAAPGGIAGTGIKVGFLQRAAVTEHTKADPGPAPETWSGSYETKAAGSAGVIAMIDLLIADLSKEMDEARTGEKNAQGEYEKFLGAAAATRKQDNASLSAKASGKAALEGQLQSQKEATQADATQLSMTMQYIASLHAECDWLLKYYDVRKEARDGEVESLKNAKAVLSGATYSLF